MPFRLRYHPDVRKHDTPRLNERLKERIKKAIEERLMTAPHLCGEPLRKSLKGYWKLRVGDYRVVYKIKGEEILILAICHRRYVYDEMAERQD